MIEKIRDNFVSGVERLKWFSGLLSERVKSELSIMRLAGEMKELEKKTDMAARAVGQRVFEVKGQEGADILSDQRIKDALKEMDRLISETEEVRKKISEISKAGVE